MAMIGVGYGSECHLLRYLGRHRQLLNRCVCEVISGSALEWLDFPFDARKPWKDGEWQALAFLANDVALQQAWAEYWPQSGNAQNWDAVGRITVNGAEEWLLVEAKANEEELLSDCGAVSTASISKIGQAMAETKRALDVAAECDWLRGHYQYCNRLAALHFLVQQHQIPARLLFIFFTGDRVPNRTCPTSPQAWKDGALARQSAHVGLSPGHWLEDRVHQLFLPVCL